MESDEATNEHRELRKQRQSRRAKKRVDEQMSGWAGWLAGRRVNGGINRQMGKEPELASPKAPLISEDFPAPIFNK